MPKWLAYYLISLWKHMRVSVLLSGPLDACRAEIGSLSFLVSNSMTISCALHQIILHPQSLRKQGLLILIFGKSLLVQLDRGRGQADTANPCMNLTVLTWLKLVPSLTVNRWSDKENGSVKHLLQCQLTLICQNIISHIAILGESYLSCSVRCLISWYIEFMRYGHTNDICKWGWS